MQEYSGRWILWKTKEELEAILRDRAGNLGDARLEITPDAVWGWYATVHDEDKSPTEVRQARVDSVVDELRNSFSLRS